MANVAPVRDRISVGAPRTHANFKLFYFIYTAPFIKGKMVETYNLKKYISIRKLGSLGTNQKSLSSCELASRISEGWYTYNFFF
jgi:hypothetical protein